MKLDKLKEGSFQSKDTGVNSPLFAFMAIC